MNYLTEETLLKKIDNLDFNLKKYWKTYKLRYKYMKCVIDELKLINPTTAIELGVAGVSVMDFSDTIDLSERMIDNKHTDYYPTGKGWQGEG